MFFHLSFHPKKGRADKRHYILQDFVSVPEKETIVEKAAIKFWLTSKSHKKISFIKICGPLVLHVTVSPVFHITMFPVFHVTFFPVFHVTILL